MKTKLVIYIERENGSRVTAANEVWFDSETLALKMLKYIIKVFLLDKKRR